MNICGMNVEGSIYWCLPCPAFLSHGMTSVWKNGNPFLEAQVKEKFITGIQGISWNQWQEVEAEMSHGCHLVSQVTFVPGLGL